MDAIEPISNPSLPRRSKADAMNGYFSSSLDLQAGLRVCEIMVSACPPEVVGELARMRRSWNDGKELVPV